MSKLTSRSDVVWFVGVGIALALAALKWDGTRSVDANFLALLPQAQHDPLVDAAAARLVRATEDRMFWLVGGGSREAAASAAATLSQMLESSALFQRADTSTDTSSISRYAPLYPYRFQLLDATTLRSLESDPESIVATAIGNTMGPFGVLRTQQLVTDPLGLFPHYLGTLMPTGIELFDGMPMVRSGDKHYALLLTTAIRGAFDLDETESLLGLVAQARAWAATRNVELLVTGVPLFAATNAQRAQFEVSIVGTGSMIAVILLFLITFRSARPLLLATLAIGTGLLVAFTVSIWLFDRVHLLTFVFGATLIGVSDDYALHYLCDAFRSPNWSPKDATRRVLPGLALGLATTLMAYASLGIAPFPALRQIAVFCGAGLLGAWLTVVLLLPSHTKALRSSPAMMRMGLAYAQRFPLIADRWVFVSAGLGLAALAALFYCIQPSDDVRLLQTQMPQLTQEAASIESLIASRRDNQFLLVEATSAEATLNAERSVRAVLDLLVEAQKLRAYSAISSQYPSPAEQHRNYQQLKAKLYDTGAMQRFFDVLHARPEAMAAHRAEFDSSVDRSVPLEEWLAIVGSPWSELWLGCSNGRCASLITLNGYAALAPDDIASLSAVPGVRVIDRVSEISATMAKYRVIAGQLLAIAYAAAAILMCARYGTRRAVRVLIVPLGAALITVAALTAAGLALNLFTVCALLLVVGMAFDDAIFFAFHGRDSAPTALAVLMSATTTLVSFGLLSLSSTPVVRDFGITLALGIASAYLLAPIAASALSNEHSPELEGNA